MKTLRRNNIKAVAEVLSEITEKRRIMEERKNPVAKKKTEGKQKGEKKKNTLNMEDGECDGYIEIRRNIIIEDTPMKTLRRNNIKAVAEVLSEITEKRRRIMEERKNPVAKKKTEGKQKDEKKKNTLNKPSLLCEQSAALRMEDGDAE